MRDKESQTLKTLLQFAKQCRGKMIAAVFIAILGVACGMVPYFIVGKITIEVMNGLIDLSTLGGYVLIALIGYTGKVLFHSISTSLSHQSAYDILKSIREQLARKLYNRPLGDVLSTPSGEYKTIIVDIVEKMEQPLAHIIPELTSNLLVPVCILIHLFYLDFRIALISLITIPIGMILYKFLMKRYAYYYREYIEANNNMNAAVIEYINGIETIKAFNQSTESYEKYTGSVENNNKTKVAFFSNTLWLYSAVMYTMPSTLLFVLPTGLYFNMNGTLSAENLVTCVILSFGLVSPLIAAMHHTDGIASLKTTLGEITKILSQPELKRPLTYCRPQDYQISFDRVTFAYEYENVLEKVSFKTIPNGMTAIVGPSGSGKSTIGKLIANFWDVKSGAINIGGKDIRNLPLNQVSDIISYVSQDNFLFNMSIKDNIKIGKKDASDFEVIEAAKKASCHRFIMSLDKGYETLAGEAGNHLSGGEKQRIAIARAILKDSPVVILDEATAYTDPENEAIIQESINNLVKGKTLIVIAHRLSTIVDADQIIVMNQGEILARGNHTSLLNNCEYYQKMWYAHVNERIPDYKKEVM
ncbi:ABC transporter ATP-binding protein [Wukongibacter sp. M2B1]|uniref:ABC transporter ATP-binding protein n=1 Tax=Wukongibacter sp. M2B1 TaxID=3088895 RepID=UPI003D79BB58